MKKEPKRQWIAALRSGEYTQGRQALKKEIDGEFLHCCLGVLCELAIKAGIPVDIQRNEIGTWTFDGRLGDLPEAVMKWSGINSPVGEFEPGGWDTLATFNDSGHAFAEIADLIEEYF